MSRLSNLLRQVETKDPQLAANLKREVEVLSGRRAFGLNFKRHIPETVEGDDPSVLLATPPPDGGWTPRLGRTVTVRPRP